MPAVVLALLLAVAAAVRLGLLLQEWPASNSDEGTMGLMALHVAEGRHFPAFMYGQSYMGTLEAYAAAPGFAVSGPSLLGLRLPMLVLYLLFLVALYLLARRLYGTSVAVTSVALLALGSRELYGSQLVAQGAVPETLLTGALLLLLGHRLLERAGEPGSPAAQRCRLAGWGATAALGLWSTVLTAPFVLSSAALLWMAVRRPESRPRGALTALGGGLLAGSLPWLLHDLSRPWRDSGVVGVVTVYLNGGTGLDGAQSPGLLAQLVNTVTTSLAYVGGGSALAHPSSPPAWPYGYTGSWRPPTDDPVSTVWGVALVLLWGTGVVTGLRALRHPAGSVAGQEGGARAAGYARLALLAAAGLTVLAFAVSPTPGVAPANNARYLVGVLVATPAVIAPLWTLHRSRPPIGGPLRAAVLGVAAVSLVLGTVQAYRDAGRGPAEAGSRQLLDALRGNGITHLYSGYLDCNRLTFLSREEVTCAVLAGGPATGLRPGFDRYPPYRAAVAADPAAGYAFRIGDARNDVLARSACRWSHRWQVAGYEVWQPADGCPISG